MKDIILLLGVVACVMGEAPYPPSGWRPQGPAFELPQSQPQQPRLPIEPRNPNTYNPYEPDLSVQGLPSQEQQPLFQLSPINGRQYLGPSFNNDVMNLQNNFRDSQYQLQQEKAREFERQKQLAQANQNFNPQIPRQFPAAPPTPAKPEPKTSKPEITTENSLNEGEITEKDSEKEKVSVEVTKQNVQEFPPELLLNPIAQLRFAQPQLQYAQLQQIGQLRAPLYFQAQIPEKQLAPGYDGETHFAALTTILNQNRAAAQTNKNPSLILARVQNPVEPGFLIPQTQIQPEIYPQSQLQPAVQPQQALFPMQSEYGQPKQNEDPTQPQIIYQTYQPQNVYQIPANQDPNLIAQAQYTIPNQDLSLYYQNQLIQQQLVRNPQLAQQQGQDAFLQSGLDANQQGNDIDQPEQESDDNDANTATAVATAFGTRTQPRVFTQYGAPLPIPRSQLNPAFQTTTEQPSQEEVTEVDPNVAEATAVARSGRKKSAKLRSRRVRPVFTLDKSGHLVLAQEQ